MRAFRDKLLALGFGLVLAFLILEIFLRIYNPFPFRLKGDRIILPAGENYEIVNTLFPELEDTIRHRKNSMGFRGPEFPEDISFSMLTVGGSTTECFYLSDGLDWPARLSDRLKSEFPEHWLNNAGLNGHSTHGHQILVQDALLQLEPDYILFLVGLNDIGRDDLHRLEQLFLKEETPPLKNWLREHSELFSLIANLRRVQRAKEKALWHDSHKLPNAKQRLMSVAARKQAVDEEAPLLEAYERRLRSMMDLCLENGISPILITQPHLAGRGIDPVTGGDLELVELGDLDGWTTWSILQKYNALTTELATEKGLLCIDLGNRLPKSTAYYYDFTHYTPRGADTVASIIASDLIPWLRQDQSP